MEGPAYVDFTHTTNSTLPMIGLIPVFQGIGMFFGSFGPALYLCMYFIKKYQYTPQSTGTTEPDKETSTTGADSISTDKEITATGAADTERREQYIPKYCILTCISIVFLAAIMSENILNSFAASFFQYQPVLRVPAPQASVIVSAMNGAFSFGRLISVFIAFYVKPDLMVIVQLFITLGKGGYIFMLFGQDNYATLWCSAIIIAFGFSTIWICLFSFVGRYMPLTDRIGGWFIGPCNISYVILCYFVSEFILRDPSIFLYISIAGVGIAMPGPAYVDFQYTTNSSLDMISLAPAFTGVGIFAGSFGPLLVQGYVIGNDICPGVNKTQCTRPQLEIPYLIGGVVEIIGPIFYFSMFFIKKYHYISDFESTDTSTTKPVDWERRKQYIPKRFILSCVSVVFFAAILAENLFNTWAPTYFQYQPVLHVPASTAADIMSASNGAFSFGRLVSVFIAFYVKPAYMIIVQLFIALAGYVYLYFGQDVMLNLWLSAVVVGLGFSTIWICLFTFVGRYMPLTDRIGGWFIGPCNISYIVLCYYISELIQTDPNVYLYINIAGVVVGIIAFSVAWFSGITQSMEGPAFVDFTYTTNSTLSLIGLVPALQGVGMFFGSLATFLFKYIDRQNYLAFSILLMSVSTICFPIATNLLQIWLCSFIYGLGIGSWNGCNYVVIIEMWTYRSPQMILWSQVFWSVGAIIGPLITQNFVIGAIAYFAMYFIRKYDYTKTTDTTDTTCADIAERRKRVIPKYFILGCISIVQLTAIMAEYSYLTFSATFYQYQPVLLSFS
ncbi:unnamed protein product [Oppiella nova]|uniref:Uncharacterized protein n=1 Tax=Oppiella nova TaxID=334625 RepID=A0A7R9LTV6_9ACAR|nr:unnamed protein product [Oppiella nova]CAG2166904.1 unnamed protein product [Oppiella nova]